MSELKKVSAVKDNDGHWYVIPMEMITDFNNLLDLSEYESNIDWESSEEKFIDIFSKYMTGGDLNNTQLWAEI